MQSDPNSADPDVVRGRNMAARNVIDLMYACMAAVFRLPGESAPAAFGRIEYFLVENEDSALRSTKKKVNCAQLRRWLQEFRFNVRQP